MLAINELVSIRKVKRQNPAIVSVPSKMNGKKKSLSGNVELKGDAFRSTAKGADCLCPHGAVELKQ